MTTAATILFVGPDLCARVNVLASVGYMILACECEANSLREALQHGPVDAILFQCLPEPPSPMILATARALTEAPFILFAGPSQEVSPHAFAAVIVGLCSPQEWLPPIAEAIAVYWDPDRAKPPQSEPVATPLINGHKYNSTR